VSDPGGDGIELKTLVRGDGIVVQGSTAAPVVINPAYGLLRDVVCRFQGLLGKLDTLLYEISHPYHNWKLIIPELRAFVLKNLNHYRDHEQGPEAFTLFMSIFFDALRDSSRNEQLLQRILEAMLADARQSGPGAPYRRPPTGRRRPAHRRTVAAGLGRPRR